MISFKHISIKDFIKPYTSTTPNQQQIEKFRSNIQAILQEALKHHREKSQEQEIEDFLANSFPYHIRSRDNIDLAVLVDDRVNVIIEVKAHKNQKEFVASADFPLAKALCEAMFYFLKERNEGNNFLKHIIVCTFNEYYIYDAQDFVQFQKNKKIKELFEGYKDKIVADPSTEAFYDEVEDYLKSPNFTGELPYTYFHLSDNLSTEELSTIYQLLSPQVILKARKTLDANTLNKNFYEELLYILGLQEESENGKSGGKIIIKPSAIPNTLSSEISRHYGLGAEEVFTLITTWNNRILFLALLESMLLSFKHINQPFLDYSIIKDFKTLQTLFFEVLAKKVQDRSPSLPKKFLDIPYLNSSLFDPIALEREGKHIGGLDSYELTLFPRSILKKDSRFKNKDSLPLLEYLFEFLHTYDFTTTPKDISQGVKQNHDKLINSAVLGLVFEKLNGYKEGSFYTPSFITSYMCKQSITQATLEKFNTTYSWKCQSLKELREEMGIKGFREHKEEYFQTLLSLRICDPSVGSGHFLVSALNEMIYIAYTLKLIPSLYESTLELENDEILIKTNNELHQYTKPSSPIQTSHQIQEQLFNLKKSIIENCLFGVDINPNSCEITKLRLWIELLKYSYYLFDEKGANTNALETLPNIDINIKCGNSLISNFPLDSNLTIGQTKSFSNNLKTQIQNYKDSVMLYKNGLGEKSKILQDIANVKSTIISYLVEKNPAKLELKDSLQAFIRDYGEGVFDLNTSFGLEMRRIAQENSYKFTATLTSLEPAPLDKNAHKLLEKIQTSYQTLENLKSSDAFEWRFEFPEVLDSEGNFLGFDCVIGNPPYISAPSQESDLALSIQRKKLADSKTYKSLYQKWDLYIPFIELGISKLCHQKGICSMIIPYPLTNQNYGKKLREMLTSEFNLYELTDLRGTKIFESAVVENCIIFADKQLPQNQVIISSIDENLKINHALTKSYAELIQDKKTQVWNTTQERRDTNRHADLNVLGDFCYVSYGLRPNSDEKTAKGEFTKADLISEKQTEIHCREYIEAKDFEKYQIKRVRYLEYGTERSPAKLVRPTFSELYEHPKLLCNRLGSLQCTYNNNRILHNDSIITAVLWKDLQGVENKSISSSIKKFSRLTREQMEQLSQSMNLFLILGILNSSYASVLLTNLRGDDYHIYPEHIRNIPIPKITKPNQKIANQIIALVEQILKAKEQNPTSSTQELESQIDSLVYSLYGLSEEEIAIVEGKE